MASTAIPTVSIIPAIPGKVNVAPKSVNTPINKKRLIISVRLAIIPKNLYLYNINETTKKKPIINDRIPASIESFPRSGPTVLSSMIFKGAGYAPDLKRRAKSVAD